MQERRRSTRRTTARVLRGRVYFYVNNRRASLPCLIRDMAYEGARIILADRSNIPDEVDLYIPERKRIAHASVQWRRGGKIGLALSYVEPHQRNVRHARASCCREASFEASPRPIVPAFCELTAIHRAYLGAGQQASPAFSGRDTDKPYPSALILGRRINWTIPRPDCGFSFRAMLFWGPPSETPARSRIFFSSGLERLLEKRFIGSAYICAGRSGPPQCQLPGQ